MRLKILRSLSCRLSFLMIFVSISIFMVTATTNTSSECSCSHTNLIDPSTLSTSVVSRRKIFRFSISSALFSYEKADVKIERQVTFTSMALQFNPRPSELFPVDTFAMALFAGVETELFWLSSSSGNEPQCLQISRNIANDVNYACERMSLRQSSVFLIHPSALLQALKLKGFEKI